MSCIRFQKPLLRAWFWRVGGEVGVMAVAAGASVGQGEVHHRSQGDGGGQGMGLSPCALLQQRYNASTVGGWHGAPRHGTARKHAVARTIALWRLQGLGASRRTLPPPPLDRGWDWVGAGMAVGARGSNQRSRTGLPGSTRPSCHLGGVQPGPCHPPWCGGARPMPDRNDGPGTTHRGGGQVALSLDPLGRGNFSLWLALFQCPWHMEHA